MSFLKSVHQRLIFPTLLLLGILGFPGNVRAEQGWKATVGAQNKDMSRQVAAFLPNEMWIHEGDQITWTFASGDIHTVTFLTLGQVFPANQNAGCPGFSASPEPSTAQLASQASPSARRRQLRQHSPSSSQHRETTRSFASFIQKCLA